MLRLPHGAERKAGERRRPHGRQPDFELVSWSQGMVRHNFVRTGGTTNATLTPGRAARDVRRRCDDRPGIQPAGDGGRDRQSRRSASRAPAGRPNEEAAARDSEADQRSLAAAGARRGLDGRTAPWQPGRDYRRRRCGRQSRQRIRADKRMGTSWRRSIRCCRRRVSTRIECKRKDCRMRDAGEQGKAFKLHAPAPCILHPASSTTNYARTRNCRSAAAAMERAVR